MAFQTFVWTHSLNLRISSELHDSSVDGARRLPRRGYAAVAYDVGRMTSASRLTTAPVLALLAVLLGTVVYLNALGNPFVFDDTTEILENPSITQPAQIGGRVGKRRI